MPPVIETSAYIIGEEMRQTSQDFAVDPCSSMKRGAMVRAARALLSAVTRLLILADMVDVHLLMKSLGLVCNPSTALFNGRTNYKLILEIVTTINVQIIN